MNKLYMGIDAGHTKIKGIIIDEYNNIIVSSIINTQDKPIDMTKLLIKNMIKEIDLKKYTITSAGVTGVYRNLIGLLLNTNIIKSEIAAETEGVLNFYPNSKKIISLGGTNSKVITINKKDKIDYSYETILTPITGEIISNTAKKLKITNEELNNINIKKTNKIDINKKNIILTENDIDDTIKKPYFKEDIITSLCQEAVKYYMDKINKEEEYILIGGISKNKIITTIMKEYLKNNLTVSKRGIFLAAFGIASLTRKSPKENIFNYDIDSISIKTQITTCNKCQNNCQIVNIYKNNVLVDYWGNHCHLET